MSEILTYNPLAQITETFSWNTAVTSCWSAEERISLRDDPSLSITYSYAIGSDTKLSDFYDFSETNLGIPVRIPMWSSPHFHPGIVLSAATSISLTDSLLHYYLSPGDEVIIWKSATSYSPLVVNTISPSAISFTTTIGSDFSAFYILPLLTGRFNKAVNFTKGAGSRKRASLVFEVLNFVLPDPYNGYRVDKLLQSIDFSTAAVRDREIVSSALGIYENLPTSEIIKEAWKGGFNFVSPSDLVDFLILLKSLKGRAVSFPLPYTYLSPTGNSVVFLSSDSVMVEYSFPSRASVSLELEEIPPSAIPTYEIYAASPSVYEGQTLSFTVATTLVPDGTTLYYTVLNNTTEGITDISPISGSVVISSGSTTFTLSILTDALTEGTETFQVELRTIHVSGDVVAISQVVSIRERTPLDIIFPHTGWGLTNSQQDINYSCFKISGNAPLIPLTGNSYVAAIGQAAANASTLGGITAYLIQPAPTYDTYTGDQNVNAINGVYRYRLSFNLSEYDLTNLNIQGICQADDYWQVFLNGTAITALITNYTPSPFTLPVTLLLQTDNTLDFVVTNLANTGATNWNPTGVIVVFTTRTYQPTP